MIALKHNPAFARPEERQRAFLPEDLQRGALLTAGLKSLLRCGALRCLAPFRRLLSRPEDGSFGILMYHRVSPRIAGAPAPTWNVTPRRFAAQLSGLLQRGFRPWPLRRILERHLAGEAIPARSFVVTFDDGYANNYHHAWPILRELQIPATIFLATAYLDSAEPFPCDDWLAAGSHHVPSQSWRPLSTSQCARMLRGGLMELGAHTHTHRDFRGQPEVLTADLKRCLAVLRSRFGVERATFAFPYGTKRLGFSGPVLAEAARKAGVLCSLTTESERVGPHSSPFDWGRFTAEGTDTAATLALKLSGGFEMLQRIWRRLRGDKARSTPPAERRQPPCTHPQESA